MSLAETSPHGLLRDIARRLDSRHPEMLPTLLDRLWRLGAWSCDTAAVLSTLLGSLVCRAGLARPASFCRYQKLPGGLPLFYKDRGTDGTGQLIK